MSNLLAKLWGIFYDKHMGPAEKMERLDQYRGQGENETVYTLQNRLHEQAGDGLSDRDLIAALAQRERESGK